MPARKPEPKPAAGQGPKKTTRRTWLKRGLIAASVVGVGAAGYFSGNVSRRRKVAARAEKLRSHLMEQPKELAALSLKHGLTESQAVKLGVITQTLQEKHPSMTHARVFETIGRNFANSKDASSCSNIIDALNVRIRHVKGKVSEAELARLKRVVRVFEELQKVEKSSKKDFDAIRANLSKGFDFH